MQIANWLLYIHAHAWSLRGWLSFGVMWLTLIVTSHSVNQLSSPIGQNTLYCNTLYHSVGLCALIEHDIILVAVCVMAGKVLSIARLLCFRSILNRLFLESTVLHWNWLYPIALLSPSVRGSIPGPLDRCAQTKHMSIISAAYPPKCTHCITGAIMTSMYQEEACTNFWWKDVFVVTIQLLWRPGTKRRCNTSLIGWWGEHTAFCVCVCGGTWKLQTTWTLYTVYNITYMAHFWIFCMTWLTGVYSVLFVVVSFHLAWGVTHCYCYTLCLAADSGLIHVHALYTVNDTVYVYPYKVFTCVLVCSFMEGTLCPGWLSLGLSQPNARAWIVDQRPLDQVCPNYWCSLSQPLTHQSWHITSPHRWP